ncbi:hypothetical protein ACVD09_24810 [Escherichia coli]
MNLVDAFVKKVISGPYKEYGKWWIDVEYILDWPHESPDNQYHLNK